MISADNGLGGYLDRFARVQKTFGLQWQDRLEERRCSGDKIWIWGAGSRATSFCANLPDPSVVTGVIDINPNRSGTFVPGSDWETFEPSHISGNCNLTVVIMNRVYNQEIATQLSGIGATARILCIDN